jgi:hypothetical protein
MYTLTEDEQRICRKLRQLKGYPRWRYHNPRPVSAADELNKTFLFYVGRGHWVQEVSKYRLNPELWQAGKVADKTIHLFSDLQDALDYGAKLANEKFAKKQAWKFERAKTHYMGTLLSI